MTTYQKLSETEIIDRVICGDTPLFEVLLRRYNPYLYKVGRSYGFLHHDVEDLMQETFIHAFENLKTLHNKAYFKTWLIRIMLNECYRKSHKASSQKEVVTDTFILEKSTPMFSVNNNYDPERKMNNKELIDIVENAIEHLPIDYRLVFSLRELYGLSVLETARTLNISETNVKVRFSRARVMLRNEVGKRYAPEEIFQFNLIYCDKIVSAVMESIYQKKINPPL